MKTFRHRDGLFPPMRTALDYCPVPYYLIEHDEGQVVLVGTDGVERPAMGGMGDRQDWIEFEPHDVTDWAQMPVAQETLCHA